MLVGELGLVPKTNKIGASAKKNFLGPIQNFKIVKKNIFFILVLASEFVF